MSPAVRASDRAQVEAALVVGIGLVGSPASVVGGGRARGQRFPIDGLGVLLDGIPSIEEAGLENVEAGDLELGPRTLQGTDKGWGVGF